MGKLRFRQVHLDFHTSEQIMGIGVDFDPKDFVKTLKDAGVDSITCFARCHHGMIYYDTKFDARHPGMEFDLLRAQIEACHEEGINAPIYITVGWDEYMAKLHPEWLARNADGTPHGAGPLQAGWKKLCFNSPYIDYVREQTVEVLEKFEGQVDGLFFDIISQSPCYCSYCMESMLNQGLDPECKDQATSFAEGVVNKFKEDMTDLIRKYDKDCSIFYNAGHVGPSIRDSLDTYSHLELESLPSGGWGYSHFPITVRFARNLGKEYLGMTGKFHKSWADFGGFKNQASLEYECFMSLAYGAKCSIGDQLHPSGAINKATYELIGSVFNQVKEKEAWCDDVTGISEIAVFTPEAIIEDHIRLHPSIQGAFRMLTEAHIQFDIIDGKMDFNKYRVILMPDVITLDETLEAKFKEYLDNGGKIISSYKSGLNRDESQFALEGLGLDLVGDAEYSPDFILPGSSLDKGILDTEYAMYDRGLYVEPKEDTEKLAAIWDPYFNRNYKHFCSHFQTPVEKESKYPAVTRKGNAIYFAHSIFSMYYEHGMRAYKQLVLNALDLLLPERIILTNAPTTAQISLNYQEEEDRYIAHILHYIPERRYARIDTIEDIIPIYDIELKILMDKEPKKVYCAPTMEELEFSYDGKYVNLVVPKVIGHQMVVFE